VPRIDISSLSLGAELGSGGQGTVTAVAGLQADGQPAVLKTYSAAAAATLDSAALEAAIALPRELSPDDSSWLRDTAAWPAVLVEDGGAACGFLMRAVPGACYFDFRTQTRGSVRKLADMAFLLNPDSYLARSGLQINDRDRIDLLASVAGTLARLHALEVIAGDLSPKNLLFSLAPPAGCFLIDCDAMHVRDRSALPQVQTPDWEVPAGEAAATAAADAYKLALLAIRLFARDQSSTDPAALTAISPRLGHLAETSLTCGPATRPAPRDWISPLRAASTAAAAPRISIPISPIPDVPGPVPAARQAPTASGPSTPGRWSAARIRILAAVAAVILVIIVIAAHLSAQPAALGSPAGADQQHVSAPPAASGTPSLPGSSPSASSPPAASLVSIAPAAAADPASAAVAQMLTTYFSSINDHRYYRALSVFAPGGAAGSPSFEHGFARGLATTADSRIVLESLLPAGSPSQATVAFRSHQAPGYGPADDPSATCTTWDITYQLHQDGDRYQIARVAAASDAPC
jgi:hypothetical protein